MRMPPGYLTQSIIQIAGFDPGFSKSANSVLGIPTDRAVFEQSGLMVIGERLA